MNYFSPFIGGHGENRLIHQHVPESAGPAPGQGLPGYEQLYYNYQQAIARLQKLEYQMLNMQTNAPRAAQNWAAQEAATAQQMHWYRMGGPFAMGAAPQRYSNIGTRARLWNNQMQYMQYQQQWMQRQQHVRNSPPTPQPEYLRGLGRNPDAGPSGAPGRRRDVRRVAQRGPRSAEMQERNMPVRNQQASNLPSYLTNWIGGGSTEKDRKENNVYFYRNTPEGYVPELVRSRGRFVRGERTGGGPPDDSFSQVRPRTRPVRSGRNEDDAARDYTPRLGRSPERTSNVPYYRGIDGDLVRHNERLRGQRAYIHEVPFNNTGDNPETALRISSSSSRTGALYYPAGRPPFWNSESAYALLRDYGIILDPVHFGDGRVRSVSIGFTQPGMYYINNRPITVTAEQIEASPIVPRRLENTP